MLNGTIQRAIGCVLFVLRLIVKNHLKMFVWSNSKAFDCESHAEYRVATGKNLQLSLPLLTSASRTNGADYSRHGPWPSPFVLNPFVLTASGILDRINYS
jgi:hypothetical protein